MQIVIDIDEEIYNFVQNTSFVEDESTLFKQTNAERQKTLYLFDILDAIKNGAPLPEEHGDLIDRTKLYDQTSAWEAQALEQVNRYNPEDSRDEWRWWSAVLNERGAFKHDVADAPTIIEEKLEEKLKDD